MNKITSEIEKEQVTQGQKECVWGFLWFVLGCVSICGFVFEHSM